MKKNFKKIAVLLVCAVIVGLVATAVVGCGPDVGNRTTVMFQAANMNTNLKE